MTAEDVCCERSSVQSLSRRRALPFSSFSVSSGPSGSVLSHSVPGGFSANEGGLLCFTGARAKGEVAPIAAVRVLGLESQTLLSGPDQWGASMALRSCYHLKRLPVYALKILIPPFDLIRQNRLV